MKTSYEEGRYPVWNKCEYVEVKLQEDLTFESDMRVIIKNEKKGFFGGISDKIIGEFAIPVSSMIKNEMCDRP